jgi:hypothetical protein
MREGCEFNQKMCELKKFQGLSTNPFGFEIP